MAGKKKSQLIVDPETVAELRITIEDIDPPVWRQLLVPRSMTLADLHDVIQEAFGWWDYHLHEYEVGGLSFGDAEYLNEMLSEEDRHSFPEDQVRLRDFSAQTPHFFYVYDFGDNWVHRIELVGLRVMEPGRRYPACVGGARSRPPEDVGGTSGYRQFLDILADPEDPEHNDMRRWAGPGFDPEAFDLAKTDHAVRNARRRAQARRRKAAQDSSSEPW